jgi:hypothetical protein
VTGHKAYNLKAAMLYILLCTFKIEYSVIKEKEKESFLK